MKYRYENSSWRIYFYREIGSNWYKSRALKPVIRYFKAIFIPSGRNKLSQETVHPDRRAYALRLHKGGLNPGLSDIVERGNFAQIF